jgi:hypothetical protein
MVECILNDQTGTVDGVKLIAGMETMLVDDNYFVG